MAAVETGEKRETIFQKRNFCSNGLEKTHRLGPRRLTHPETKKRRLFEGRRPLPARGDQDGRRAERNS